MQLLFLDEVFPWGNLNCGGSDWEVLVLILFI